MTSSQSQSAGSLSNVTRAVINLNGGSWSMRWDSPVVNGQVDTFEPIVTIVTRGGESRVPTDTALHSMKNWVNDIIATSDRSGSFGEPRPNADLNVMSYTLHEPGGIYIGQVSPFRSTLNRQARQHMPLDDIPPPGTFDVAKCLRVFSHIHTIDKSASSRRETSAVISLRCSSRRDLPPDVLEFADARSSDGSRITLDPAEKRRLGSIALEAMVEATPRGLCHNQQSPFWYVQSVTTGTAGSPRTETLIKPCKADFHVYIPRNPSRLGSGTPLRPFKREAREVIILDSDDDLSYIKTEEMSDA